MTNASTHTRFLRETVASAHETRALAAAFAPGAERAHYLAVAAFEAEVEKTAETVSEPMLGQIRLAWWREALGEATGVGEPRRHPVVEALAELHRAGRLDAEAAAALIDAREHELEPGAVSLPDHARILGRSWAALAARALGGDTDKSAENLGVAALWARELTRAGARAAHGVCLVADDVLEAAGASRDGVINGRDGKAFASVIEHYARGPAHEALAAIGGAPASDALGPLLAEAAAGRLALRRLADGRPTRAPMATRLAMVRAVARGRI